MNRVHVMSNITPSLYIVKSAFKRTHWDHENIFLITGVPYKRIVSKFRGKD